MCLCLREKRTQEHVVYDAVLAIQLAVHQHVESAKEFYGPQIRNWVAKPRSPHRALKKHRKEKSNRDMEGAMQI